MELSSNVERFLGKLVSVKAGIMENRHLENVGLILITRSCFSSEVHLRTSEVMLTGDLNYGK